MTPREKDIILLQRAAGGFERVKIARAIWGAQDIFKKRQRLHCCPFPLFVKTIIDRSWACAELSTLLGSFFCVSSLHGIVALGSGVHQDADPPSFWGPQGELTEGLGCCLTCHPCGAAKGSLQPHFSTIRLWAKVPLTAPPSKLPSPKPAT